MAAQETAFRLVPSVSEHSDGWHSLLDSTLPPQPKNSSKYARSVLSAHDPRNFSTFDDPSIASGDQAVPRPKPHRARRRREQINQPSDEWAALLEASLSPPVLSTHTATPSESTGASAGAATETDTSYHKSSRSAAISLRLNSLKISEISNLNSGNDANPSEDQEHQQIRFIQRDHANSGSHDDLETDSRATTASNPASPWVPGSPAVRMIIPNSPLWLSSPSPAVSGGQMKELSLGGGPLSPRSPAAFPYLSIQQSRLSEAVSPRRRTATQPSASGRSRIVSTTARDADESESEDKTGPITVNANVPISLADLFPIDTPSTHLKPTVPKPLPSPGARTHVETFVEIDDDGRPIQPGDILSFQRGMYSHDTIYVGNGEVVHLWNGDENIDFNKEAQGAPRTVVHFVDSLKIKLEKFAETLRKNVLSRRPRVARVVKSAVHQIRFGCRMRVRVIKRRLPLTREEIVSRALSALGKETVYHVILRNCQHFTTWAQGHTVSSRDLSNYISLLTGLTVAGNGILVGKRFLGVRGGMLGFAVGAIVGAFVGVFGMFTFDLTRERTGEDGHLKWLKSRVDLS